MGEVVRQEKNLVPVKNFSDLTEDLAKRWIEKGRQDVGQTLKDFPDLPAAYVYVFAMLFLSLRNGMRNHNIEESGRCHHSQIMLTTTSQLIDLTGRMAKAFPDRKEATAKLTDESEEFCKHNADFCDISLGKLAGIQCPTAATTYIVISDGDIPTIISTRLERLKRKYNPPIEVDRVVGLLRDVVSECINNPNSNTKSDTLGVREKPEQHKVEDRGEDAIRVTLGDVVAQQRARHYRLPNLHV